MQIKKFPNSKLWEKENLWVLSSLTQKQFEVGNEILELIKTKDLKVIEARDMFLELANAVLATKVK